jgi:hypothetical protein
MKVTVYVGKLAEGIDAAYVGDVLRCAGRLSKWNRATDGDTGKPKGFGFATYRSPEEVRGVPARQTSNARISILREVAIPLRSRLYIYIHIYISLT